MTPVPLVAPTLRWQTFLPGRPSRWTVDDGHVYVVTSAPRLLVAYARDSGREVSSMELGPDGLTGPLVRLSHGGVAVPRLAAGHLRVHVVRERSIVRVDEHALSPEARRFLDTSDVAPKQQLDRPVPRPDGGYALSWSYRADQRAFLESRGADGELSWSAAEQILTGDDRAVWTLTPQADDGPRTLRCREPVTGAVQGATTRWLAHEGVATFDGGLVAVDRSNLTEAIARREAALLDAMMDQPDIDPDRFAVEWDRTHLPSPDLVCLDPTHEERWRRRVPGPIRSAVANGRWLALTTPTEVIVVDLRSGALASYGSTVDAALGVDEASVLVAMDGRLGALSRTTEGASRWEISWPELRGLQRDPGPERVDAEIVVLDEGPWLGGLLVRTSSTRLEVLG